MFDSIKNRYRRWRLHREAEIERRPPRLIFPFWIQLMLSYLLFSAIIGFMLINVWTRLWAVVEADTTARRVRAFADLSVHSVNLDDMFNGDYSMEGRAANRLCWEISDELAGAHYSDGQDVDFERLWVSVLIPTADGWIYWLSTDEENIGKPYPFSAYLDNYFDPEGGWDNFATEGDPIKIEYKPLFSRSDEVLDRERALRAAMTSDEPPPLRGVLIDEDPISSVRPLEAVIAKSRLSSETLTAAPSQLRKAVLAIEAPPTRVSEVTLMVMIVFGALFLIASLVALLVALFITWRMNRPIKALHESMVAVGQGDLRKRIKGVRSHDEFGRLAWQFNRMMTDFMRNQEIAVEVDVAARIQRDLIPAAPTSIAGVDLASWYATSALVGGDYFDFIRHEDCLWISIGDAVGHGVDSGLIMASARAMVRALAEDFRSPGEIMTRLNTLLTNDLTNGNFFTLAVVHLNLKTFEFTVCSSGHEPLIWRHAETGRQQLILRNGPPLGVTKSFEYPESKVLQFQVGDLLVLSTDGVRECHGPEDELFGRERFERTLAQPALTAADVMVNLKDALDTHRGERPPEDDISVVILRRSR
ncbi:SpoIIE family protein phosphatase [bacterium]|nr:SpoIIE family protein phosphatase [bacterium]